MRYALVRQRRRSLSLSVREDGVTEVRAPYGCPRAEIERVLAEKADWIAAQAEVRRAARAALDSPPHTLRLLGRALPVLPVQGEGIVLDPKADCVRVPAGVPLRELMPRLAGGYRELARRDLPARTAMWAEKFGLTVRSVRITSAARRWGSCSPGGALNFTWRLMMASPRAIDSVVIHELMHLIRPDHSPAFRALERENTPALEACRQELDALARDLAREGWS